MMTLPKQALVEMWTQLLKHGHQKVDSGILEQWEKLFENGRGGVSGRPPSSRSAPEGQG
ncbi:hypothetical protein BH18ACI5_BH18ACI5_10610 [soil metagenome]